MKLQLTALLQRFDEINAKKEALKEQRKSILAEKEEILQHASGPDDEAAAQKMAGLGAQEHLNSVQMGRIRRELDGIGAALVNESQQTATKIVKKLQARREALGQKLKEALTPFYAKPREVANVIERLAVTPDEEFAIHHTIAGFQSYGPNIEPEQFARLTLAKAEQAIEQFNL